MSARGTRLEEMRPNRASYHAVPMDSLEGPVVPDEFQLPKPPSNGILDFGCLPRPAWLEESGEAMLDGVAFQTLSATAILTNAIVIGFETDFPEILPWDNIEFAFLLLFTFDLLLRIYLNTPRRFFALNNKDLFWNALDCMIVCVGQFDVIAPVFSPFSPKTHSKEASASSYVTVFRIVRLLRILRIFRIVRFLKQLYLLAHGFVEGMQAVFWVAVMMTFVLYICAIVLVRCYTKRTTEDMPYYEVMVTKFGTIPQTMFSLFELMANPDLEAYHAVIFHEPTLLIFFLTFVIFGSFGMIALLTGVISESMFEKNEVKLQEESREREAKRLKFRGAFGEIFDSLDQDGSGTLCREELACTKYAIAEMFDSQGVNFARQDLESMFDFLDTDASGLIEREEFITGVVQLCDDVRPMSIMELNHQVATMSKMVMHTQSTLGVLLEEVRELGVRQAALAEHITLGEQSNRDLLQCFCALMQEDSPASMKSAPPVTRQTSPGLVSSMANGKPLDCPSFATPIAHDTAAATPTAFDERASSHAEFRSDAGASESTTTPPSRGVPGGSPQEMLFSGAPSGRKHAHLGPHLAHYHLRRHISKGKPVHGKGGDASTSGLHCTPHLDDNNHFKLPQSSGLHCAPLLDESSHFKLPQAQPPTTATFQVRV